MKNNFHFINLITLITILISSSSSAAAAATLTELPLGFTATPHSSISTFQPLLSSVDSGNFSLGFLRIDKTHLALAILHVTSSEPFWLANPTHLASWSHQTRLSFNGSLVLSDPTTDLLWSTHTNADRIILQNNSNLVLQNSTETLVWQSFDFPTDTLVENQNLTSKMALVSSNGIYSMRLGPDFIGLYAWFDKDSDQIYLKHKAMEAKTEIVENSTAPIYAQVNPDRFLGMYQTGNPLPADVQKFNSFQTPATGFMRLRIEPNGNLIGYLWDETTSKWVLDYQAISEPCELPSACGSYALCNAANGRCSCLDNSTEYNGACMKSSGDDVEEEDWCSEAGGGPSLNEFRVLRRSGVEVPYKELTWHETVGSVGECERLCETNCSCWGAVYNNGSGFCYMVDYPVQTLVSVADVGKMGYFKVREGAGRRKGISVGSGVGIGVGVAVVVLVAVAVGVWRFRVWKRGGGGGNKRGFMEQNGAVSPGPYKDLGTASFRSIEMGSST